MDYITITGVRPWDGRYEFDLDGQELTTREWGWIKRLSGYMPLTVDQGFDGADPELFSVFAAIALRRSGKIEARDVPEVFDRLADAPFGSAITLEGDSEAEGEREVNPSPTSSPASEPISGNGGPTSSASLAESPPPIGMLDSEASASHPSRLAS